MKRKNGGQNNAIKHGGFSKDLILEDEKREDFDQLHRSLIEEWNPTGALEEDTVLTIAQCIWLKRRVGRFYVREVTGGQFQDADEREFVLYLVKVLDQTPTLEEATAISRYLPEYYQKWIAEKVPWTNFQDAKSWMESLKPQIMNLVRANENFAKATQSMAYKANKATYLREVTAKKISLDERLDARIDKAIKRLAQLKTFKQIIETSAPQKSNEQRRIPDQRE